MRSIDVSREGGQFGPTEKSWVYHLPCQLAAMLSALAIIISLWNPCDSTSVAMGQSIPHIVTYLAIGVFVSMNVLLNGNTLSSASINGNFSRRTDILGVSRRLFIAGLVLFCAWVFIASTQVIGTGNARFGWNGCWQWISIVVLSIAMFDLLRSRQMAMNTTTLLISIASGAAAYAVYQYAISMPEQRAAFAADPSPFMRELGVSPGTSAAMLLKNRVNSTEPTATFALANSLAGFLVPWFVFSFGLSLSLLDCLFRRERDMVSISDAKSSSDGRSTRWFGDARIAFVLMLAVLVALFLVIGLTKSRSGWLATIVGLLGVAVTHRLFRRLYPQGLLRSKAFWGVSITVIALCVTLVYVLDPLILREALKSLSYRVEYWRGASSIVRDNLFFGVGPLNFQQAYVAVKPVVASETPADPHNLFAETAVTGGLPLLCILLFCVSAWASGSLRRGTSQTLPTPATHSSVDVGVGSRFFLVGAALGAFGIVGMMFLLDLMSPSEKSHELYSALSAAVVATLVYGVFSFTAKPLLMTTVWDSNEVAVYAFWATAAGLVNLLAAGGWMQPGTMISLCMLFVISLQSYQRVDSAGAGLSDRSLRLFAGVGLLLIGLCSYGVYSTTIAPSIRATVARESFANQFSDSIDPEQLLSVLAADPWDPELASLVCDHSVTRIGDRRRDSRSREAWKKVFERGTEELIRRDPRNWAAQRDLGQWRFLLATAVEPDAPGREEQLKLAAASYSRSAELNPTSCEVQLQSAVAWALVEEMEKASQSLVSAQSIDERTPHLDKKLSAASIYLPIGLLKGSELDRRELRDSSNPGLVKAEPVVDWLRRTAPTGK